MTHWLKKLIFVVVGLLLILFFYLLIFGGLRDYFTALRIIAASPSTEIKEGVRSQFAGSASGYGGILAGSWFNRVWVWGLGGLQSFVVDEHTLYSWFDGCNEDIKRRLDLRMNNPQPQMFFIPIEVAVVV